ncbi:MAG: tautomerase family protein [Actinomycetes bacterium]
MDAGFGGSAADRVFVAASSHGLHGRHRALPAGPRRRASAVTTTTSAAEIEGENMRRVTWVLVEEVKSRHWAIGGQPLATADVKALAAGVPVG